ncbi:ABC transporter substrate-binding protein [Arthrobacter sp. MMS18-M83]|uniref:ABC transporter substrate-binding protein n=1 Tax=Arthrobacter sp. MMS18-M83 TaxID=2996261 RepID=UPI00227AFEF0|nr:ABC transporter substrate-binding protein [Arthrobacter sp. MMS18-M83]WAH97655.1 ABC transporter substrate-binding protein [Arthrobacter sp. MMS18-M83]
MLLTRKKLRVQRAAVITASALGITLALTACGSNSSTSSATASDTSPIRIGVDLSLTGPIAFAGVQEYAGFKLAVAAINDSEAKVLGRKIELVPLDDKSTPDQSVLNIRKLVQQEKVVAIAGPGSSNSTVVGAQTATTLKIPLMASPSTTGDIWEGPNVAKWGFGAAGNGSALGNGCINSVAAAEAKNGTKVKTIAIGEETNPGPQSYVAGVKKWAAQNNVQVLTTVDWASDSTNLTTQMNQLLAAKPDVISISALQATDTLAVKALDQLGALGTTPVANCSAITLGTFYQAMGATAEKPHFYTQILLADAYPAIKTGQENDAERQKVVDAFAKYPDVAGVPNLSNFAHGGWDVIQVLARAIESAKSTDPDKIRQALEKTNYVGAQNTMVFSDTQHRSTYEDYAKIASVVVFGANGSLSIPK